VQPTVTTSATTPVAGARQAVAAREWRLVIGGELVEPVGGRYAQTIDPATEEPAATVPDADEQDVAEAVEAAREAFSPWRRVAPRDRARLVRELARLLLDHREELAFLDALDGGFPVTNMRNDVGWAADVLELFADWALELGGETIPASAEHLHYTTREPFGVVGRIVPFNHPIFFAAGKVAAPLVAGNTVVLKPADQTPLSALRFGELAAQVLPPGVVNVVCGQGPAVGQALVAHPEVRRIGFIGSDAVGRAIQRDAAEAGVKSVTLELGGKNAMIVLPDADLEKAAAGVIAGMNFIGSLGQSCGSNSRVVVHSEVAEELADRVVAGLQNLRLGSPLDDATQLGPLISEPQRERTERYVQLGQQEGAELRHGGRRPEGLDRGYFFEPTVFTGVQAESRLGQEEVFGPVLSLLEVDDVEQAVRVANGVEFGLTASVWTENLRLAHRTVRDLDAGYVWINGSSRHFWGVPFGGMKSSGVGREESLEELLSYTQTKSVHVFLE
jgi:2-formylbenzoate dehydrogenase